MYYSDVETADSKSWCRIHKTNCICCGQEILSDVVAYDMCIADPNKYVRTLMHRKCAFEMAQRIICDAWPNRNKQQ